MTQVAADARAAGRQGALRARRHIVAEGARAWRLDDHGELGPAVHEACLKRGAELLDLARGDGNSPLTAPPMRRWPSPRVGSFAGTTLPPASYREILQRHGSDGIEALGEAKPGDEAKRFSMHGFGAVFAEVHVDPDFGTVRVPRLVGAYGIGRVINPKIAHSQCISGMVGGIGMALLEDTRVDARFGR